MDTAKWSSLTIEEIDALESMLPLLKEKMKLQQELSELTSKLGAFVKKSKVASKPGRKPGRKAGRKRGRKIGAKPQVKGEVTSVEAESKTVAKKPARIRAKSAVKKGPSVMDIVVEQLNASKKAVKVSKLVEAVLQAKGLAATSKAKMNIRNTIYRSKRVRKARRGVFGLAR